MESVPKITLEEMRRILSETDWNLYREHVNWRMQMPDCHFYDGNNAKRTKSICPVWQDWITQGKKLYVRKKDQLNNYLSLLKEQIPEGFRKVEHSRIEQFLRNK